MSIEKNIYAEKEWASLCEPFQVAPKVYYVGTSFVGSYLIETSDGLILLDQAFAGSVYIILENIRKLGFNPKDIKLLLISHAHFDHCGGTRLMQDYTKAKVYLSKEDTLMMNEHPEWAHLGYINWMDFKVDENYDNNTPVKLGDISIRTVLTPGHTPGTTSFFFETRSKSGKIYKCGLHGGLGFNTMVPSFYQQYPGWPQGLLLKYIDSLIRVADEQVDIPLPSHPTQFPIMDKAGSYNEENNPFVNPDAWEAMTIERRLKANEMLKSSN